MAINNFAVDTFTAEIPMKSDDHISVAQMDELRKFMSEAIPYWKTLGLELIEVAPGHAVFEAEVRPGLLQNNVVHGGVLASIADSACAVAAITKSISSKLRHNHQSSTRVLETAQIRQVQSCSKCIKAGRSILFCEATVVDENSVIICTASSQLIAQTR
jgi:uncharacterized protein (TIGR00369 family)